MDTYIQRFADTRGMLRRSLLTLRTCGTEWLTSGPSVLSHGRDSGYAKKTWFSLCVGCRSLPEGDPSLVES